MHILISLCFTFLFLVWTGIGVYKGDPFQSLCGVIGILLFALIGLYHYHKNVVKVWSALTIGAVLETQRLGGDYDIQEVLDNTEEMERLMGMVDQIQNIKKP